MGRQLAKTAANKTTPAWSLPHKVLNYGKCSVGYGHSGTGIVRYSCEPGVMDWVESEVLKVSPIRAVEGGRAASSGQCRLSMKCRSDPVWPFFHIVRTSPWHIVYSPFFGKAHFGYRLLR